MTLQFWVLENTFYMWEEKSKEFCLIVRRLRQEEKWEIVGLLHDLDIDMVEQDSVGAFWAVEMFEKCSFT